MSAVAEPRMARNLPAVLSQGFRPFFLAAGLWAAAALGLWIVMLNTGMSLPSRFSPLSWHIHAMLFGFVMAAVAGFLLTAVPNWTRRLPVRGPALAALAGLWLLGRIACLTSQWYPPWLAIAADLAFPLVLAGVVAREILLARNWRNLAMILPLVALGVANLLMHLQACGVDIEAGLGWRLGLAAILALVSLVGGRIVPGFTRSWLALRKIKGLPAQHGHVDRLALGSLHVGLCAWAFLPLQPLVGALLVFGAICNLWRLARWQGVKTAAEPLLFILHLGYGWLSLGAGLLGASALSSLVPQSAGVHALTVGAIGTTILAVMTRATRGHTGHALAADRVTAVIYGCVMAAATLRIAAAFSTGWTMALLTAAAGLWISAFMLFVLRYAPMLLTPRARPNRA